MCYILIEKWKSREKCEIFASTLYEMLFILEISLIYADFIVFMGSTHYMEYIQ